MGKEDREWKQRKNAKEDKLLKKKMRELRRKPSAISELRGDIWIKHKKEKKSDKMGFPMKVTICSQEKLIEKLKTELVKTQQKLAENFSLHEKINEKEKLIEELKSQVDETLQISLAREKENVSLKEIIVTQEKLIKELKIGADEVMQLNTIKEKENLSLKEIINSQEKLIGELKVGVDQALQASLSREKENISLREIINTQDKLIEQLKTGVEETLQINFSKEKENLSLRGIVTTQEKIMGELNSWLNETVQAMNCLGENVETFKENFKKIFEEDLHCPICTELYIKPVTLGCSHTFCEHCINKWKTVKTECPMCREKTQTESKLLFMDNFICRALGQIDSVSLKKRMELIKSRAA